VHRPVRRAMASRRCRMVFLWQGAEIEVSV
jgi:hypothetical protein